MAYRRGEARGARHRVVVTGMGVITSLGEGVEVNAEGFRAGRQAFSKVVEFDTTGLRTDRGGVIALPSGGRIDRASEMLLRAGWEAWNQAGWAAEEMPVVLGTSAGGMEWGESFYRSKLSDPLRRRGLARLSVGYQPQSQGKNLRRALGIPGGDLLILSNACASGSNAVGHAGRLVRSGRAKRVLCAGYDAVTRMVYTGFDSLKALSPAGFPRPFDRDRDGLALGEGAAVFALETWEDAEARGAEILAEVAGYGEATDTHHLTQPHPEGDAALASMRAACADAGLNPEDIDYVNAHGTGTPLNDQAEGMAINRWAAGGRRSVRVSSTKSCTGHLLGGAGAVEAAVCVMALRGGWLPPTSTTETPDAVCEFDFVREPREADVRSALSNSFGFGGANATLILKKP